MGQMKNYQQILTEMPSKTVVFAFGRFQPPTTGHQLLVNVVARLAQQKRADHIIFASKTQDKKKNPLPVDRKVHYLKMMFPRINFMPATPEMRTFLEVAGKLYSMGYRNVVMVAGSDRQRNFNETLNKYNGKKDRHGYYKFDSIEVISAGQRDPDADDATGMSGTKMRAAAVKGNYLEFKKGLPSTMRDIDGRRLMNDIRMGLGMQAVREQVVFKKDELREQYFKGEIFNIGDVVEQGDDVYQIVNRGSNHILVQEKTGELVSKWITDVTPSEREFMLNEGLTQKTLKTSDKIKVGRVIANMLGVDNAESMSNPTQLVNMGLRNIRKKALNKAAIELIKKMCELADDMGIEYDKNLLPNALREGVIQPNGTDKIIPPTGGDATVKVDKKSNRNIAKDVLRFSDFKKMQKMTEDDETKETESDFDAENEYAKPETEVGGLMAPPYNTTDDNLRRRKVNYMRNEEASAGGEAAAKRAQKEKQRAQLQLKQTKEREALRARQDRERDQLKNEEVVTEKKKLDKGLKDACWKGYEAIGTKKKNGKTVPNCVPTNEENIDEASPFELAKKAINKKVYSKEYDHAHAAMNKEKKSAAEISKRYRHVDARELQKKYDAAGPQMRKEDTSKDTEKELASKERDAKTKGAVRPSFALYKKDTEKELASKERDAKTKGVVRPSGAVTDVPQEIVVVENCYDDLSHGGGPVVDVDDVTSSINPPHDEEFENSGVEHTDDVGSYEKQIDTLDFTDEAELNDMVNSMSDDELLDLAYDDDEVEEVDEETGEPVELDDEEMELKESLDLIEGLSRIERIKARQRLKRTAAKRQRSTKIAMKRVSSTKTANARARRAAIKKLKQRVLRGRKPNQLSVGEKERVEKFVAGKKNLINRLAMKMLPRVRQLEKKRIKNARAKK
jgi:hypothetical protein